MTRMASEVSENEAEGRIAEIFAELRYYYGAPYVSSMQRLLAAWPGVLEWAWSSVRPGFVNGVIPRTAWDLAEPRGLPALPPISRPALRVMGVDAEAETEIREVCANFAHVSPVNLLLGGCLRRLLAGEVAGGKGFEEAAWTPPEPLPPLPTMVREDALNSDQNAVLMQFTATLGETVFIPGLYRMLARHPAYLAHVATVLGPLFEDPEVTRICLEVRDRIDAAAPAVLEKLPPSDLPPPSGQIAEQVLAAVEGYRGTSPQMIVFGTLLGRALPAPNS